MKKIRTSSLYKSQWPEYGIILNEIHHARDFSMSPITRDYFKIFYVIQGGTTIIPKAGPAVLLNEKEMLAVPKGVQHQLKDLPGASGASIYVLSIRDQAFPPGCREYNLLAALNANPDLIRFRCSPFVEEFIDMAQMLRKIRHEQLDRGLNHELMIKNIVGTVLVRFQRAFENREKNGRAPDGVLSNRQKIKRVCEYINENFFEELNVGALAGMCSLTMARFSQVFKEQKGIPPLQYLHKKRVEYVKERLRKTDEKISAVCFDAGFNDLSFFYRVFRKFTGQSPLAFKQKRRKTA